MCNLVPPALCDVQLSFSSAIFSTSIQGEVSNFRSWKCGGGLNYTPTVIIFSLFAWKSSKSLKLQGNQEEWRTTTKVWPRDLKDVKWSYFTIPKIISSKMRISVAGSYPYSLLDLKEHHQHYLFDFKKVDFWYLHLFLYLAWLPGRFQKCSK